MESEGTHPSPTTVRDIIEEISSHLNALVIGLHWLEADALDTGWLSCAETRKWVATELDALDEGLRLAHLQVQQGKSMLSDIGATE